MPSRSASDSQPRRDQLVGADGWLNKLNLAFFTVGEKHTPLGIDLRRFQHRLVQIFILIFITANQIAAIPNNDLTNPTQARGSSQRHPYTKKISKDEFFDLTGNFRVFLGWNPWEAACPVLVPPSGGQAA
jgi:hypothetical protein